MKNILIIQTAFLGDLVLTTPLIREVYKKYNPCKVSVLVNKGSEDILKNNPYIHKIISLDKSKIKKSIIQFLKFAYKLKEEMFDIVISPHFSYRSSIISFLTRSKIRIGYQESGFSILHTKKVSRPTKGIHEVDKLFGLIYKKEEYPKEKRPEIFFNDNTIQQTKEYLKKNHLFPSNFIVFSPSSVWETKRMPEEKFIELAKLILENTNYSIVITGSKKDLHLSKKIETNLSNNRVINTTAETDLISLACLISLAKAIVSNDSSPVHFASAFNIPTIAIFGATVTDFGYTPLSEKHYIAEVKGLECRPCGIHGGNRCPQKHFSCMLKQDVSDIFNNLKNYL